MTYENVHTADIIIAALLIIFDSSTIAMDPLYIAYHQDGSCGVCGFGSDLSGGSPCPPYALRNFSFYLPNWPIPLLMLLLSFDNIIIIINNHHGVLFITR